MDTADLYVLRQVVDRFDADLREVDAAIELVERGEAVRVRLVGLSSAATIAPLALARAQQAGVAFRAEGTGPTTRLTIGPTD